MSGPEKRHESASSWEGVEEELLKALQAQQKYEAKVKAQARPRRSPEELKACILAFLKLLPDAPDR